MLLAAFLIVISPYVIFLLLAMIGKQKEAENKREKENFLHRMGAPVDCSQFSYLSGHPSIKEKQLLYVWKDVNTFKLISPNSNSAEYQIPIDSINYYSIKGDLKQETEFVGKTKGSTMSDTIITEAVLGTAAAMKKNQTLSKIKNVDERRTIINATLDGENCFIFFEKGDLYNLLLEQIPEKEQSFVAMQVKNT